MTRTIVCAYDGSDTAGRALDLAAELSAKLGMDLSIVHVLLHGRPAEEMVRLAEVEHIVERAATQALPDPATFYGSVYDYFGTGRSDADRARIVAAVGGELAKDARLRAEAAGARNVTANIRSGDYAEEILQEAEERDAEMIVLGRRGLGVVRNAVLGSVSLQIVQRAERTVVTVRSP